MSKQAKKGLVPELRFPEFRNRGEWEAATLGHKDIGDFVDEKVARDELSLSTYMSTSNILPDFGGVEQTASLPPSGSFTRYRVGDILISNIRPYLKKIWLATFDGAASNDVIVVRPKKKVTPSFLAQLIINDAFVGYVMKNVQGLKMPRGEKTSMAAYPVVYPKPDEQQKIAACLSSVDALLAAEREKLEALRAHKKGLMQQLFPAEGAKVPVLRFPEFGGEWEHRPLGSVCDMRAGTFIKASDILPKAGEGLYPCYGGNGLRGYAESFTHDGTFPLVGRQGSLCGNVTLASGRFHATEHALVAIGKADVKVDTLWLYHVLVHANLNQYATGQALPGLSVERLDKVLVPYVGSTDEQHEIARCLTSLDDRIALQAERIEIIEAHKRGLMQGLFPAANYERG